MEKDPKVENNMKENKQKKDCIEQTFENMEKDPKVENNTKEKEMQKNLY